MAPQLPVSEDLPPLPAPRAIEKSLSDGTLTPSVTPESQEAANDTNPLVHPATQKAQPVEINANSGNTTTISNIQQIILSGVSSVQIIQNADAGVEATTDDSTSAVDPAATTSSKQAGAEDVKLPKKTYVLGIRHRKEEHNDMGQVVTSVDYDEKKAPSETQVPVLEKVMVTVKSSSTRITISEYTMLRIASPYLLNALRWIVKQSPETLDGTEVQIKEPYKLLYNYSEDLYHYKSNHPPAHSEEYIEECNSHIDLLLGFLDKQEGARYQEMERARWRKDEPAVTWKNLWLLLRPGELMLVKKEDYTTAYMLHYIYGGVDKGGKAEEYTLGLWNIDFDGDHFGRSLMTTEIKPFEGEMAIRSLNVYPAEFAPDWPTRERDFLERGKQFVAAASGYSYMEYSGKTAEGARREYRNERVVIDYTFEPWVSAEYKDNHQPRLNRIYGNYVGGKICLCDACFNESESATDPNRNIYGELDLLSRKYITESWTGIKETMYRLCAPVLYGYVLKERRWRILDVEKLHKPTFNTEIMDTLVMNREHKEIIKAICNEFTRDDTEGASFSADPIEGKGSGRIFLLHGPPGVGKTLTAECVAENTRRPLLSITAGDLGITAERVDENLARFFKWPQDWKAILLLDEADVFLETREKRDLKRNSVVSVFLRALEYYTGIMFITTNRIGTFDEAFKSRMHISLHYSGFDDHQRKEVWRNNFTKLRKDKKNVVVDEDVMDFLYSDPEVKRLRWNGRDIRNCFQTAVTLAEFEANRDRSSNVRLKRSHLQKVMDMSTAFTKYLDEAHGLDDATSARDRGLRADNFDENAASRDDYDSRSMMGRRRAR